MPFLSNQLATTLACPFILSILACALPHAAPPCPLPVQALKPIGHPRSRGNHRQPRPLGRRADRTRTESIHVRGDVEELTCGLGRWTDVELGRWRVLQINDRHQIWLSEDMKTVRRALAGRPNRRLD